MWLKLFAVMFSLATVAFAQQTCGDLQACRTAGLSCRRTCVTQNPPPANMQQCMTNKHSSESLVQITNPATACSGAANTAGNSGSHEGGRGQGNQNGNSGMADSPLFACVMQCKKTEHDCKSKTGCGRGNPCTQTGGDLKQIETNFHQCMQAAGGGMGGGGGMGR